MVHFENFDVPVRAKPRRGLSHEMRQQRHAERGVSRLQNGDDPRGIVDCIMVRCIEASRSDDNGDTGTDCGVKVRIQGLRNGEIDQHVARIGQPRRIAAAVDTAGQFVSARRDDVSQRMAHGTFASDYPDPRHWFSM